MQEVLSFNNYNNRGEKMNNKEIKEKLNELEQYIDNIGDIQRQLASKMGYKQEWEYQPCCHKAVLKLIAIPEPPTKNKG